MALRNQKWRLLAWMTIFGGMSLTIAALSWASQLERKLRPLVGPNDSVIVTAPEGTTIVQLNANQTLVPASILKILTSLTAIETLGRHFRFKTEFYIDKKNNLKIKGYGDPLLVSEYLNDIGFQLAKKFSEIGNIILDDTYFDQPIQIPGRGTSIQPYDAPNGALCVNFNTVAFSRKNGRWVTGEPQTPLLNSVIPAIEASGLSSGRITLVASHTDALQYTGQLFQYFLMRNGVSVNGSIYKGHVDVGSDRLIWRYQSTSNLSQVISQLLEYSNNFIANQLSLMLGAKAIGPPASMKKGVKILKTYYHDTLGIKSGRIVEASGISRQNRITATAMMKIIMRFAPYYTLMRNKDRQYYKTGHLRGIRTRAGYIKSQNNRLYRFVIMLNTPGKSTHQIMQIIEKELS